MISLFFLGIFIFVFLWDFYFRKHWHKHLEVSLDFVQDYVYAGEQAQMTERIENRKRMMLPILEVAFHIRRELVFSVNGETEGHQDADVGLHEKGLLPD